MSRPEAVAQVRNPRPNVAIVGAGVAGLVCAKELAEHGCDVTLFDCSDHVGGRVATERRPDGFLLDRGFQILIRSYPELRRQLDLQKLRLRSFGQGAVLCLDSGSSGEAGPMSSSGVERHVFANPLTSPALLLQTLRLVWRWGVIATVLDVARLLLRVALPGWLHYIWSADPYAALRERWGLPLCEDSKGTQGTTTQVTTAQFLQRRVGLTSAFLFEFLEPFFESIYVSPLRFQHPSMFEFVLGRLAVPGSAALPAAGMAALPEQLLETATNAAAKASSRFDIALSTTITAVKPGVYTTSEAHSASCVELRFGASGGEVERTACFDAAVIAAEWPKASTLLGDGELEREGLPLQATSSCTWYFGLPEAKIPLREKLIVLNATGTAERRSGGDRPACRALLLKEAASDFRVCNIGFPSLVQRSYAPANQHLCAVTVMSTATPCADTLKTGLAGVREQWVRSEVARLLGCKEALDPDIWRLLEEVPILFHQPLQAPDTLETLLRRAADSHAAEESQTRLFVCGDWRSMPTLDGAMLSGRLAAERAMRVLNR